MNIKKVFGSFIFALIISVITQFGQNPVLAANCTGTISITNATTLSADKKADYTVSLPSNTCGVLSVSLFESNKSTPSVTFPIDPNQLTEIKDNANNIIGYKYTGTLDLANRFPVGQTFSMNLTLKDSAGDVVSNTPSQTVTSFGSAEPGPSPAPNPATNGSPVEAVQENTADGKPALKFTAMIKDGDLPGTTEVCAKDINGGTPVCKSYTINSQQDIDTLKANGLNIQQDLGTGNYLITDKLTLPGIGKYVVTIKNKTNPSGYIITKDVITNAPYQEAPSTGGTTGGGTTVPGGTTSGGGNNSYGGGTTDAATSALKDIVSKIFLFIFPIAVVIALIRILIAIIQITTSGGNPEKLNKAKDMLISTLLGLLLIAGAVTIINVIGSAVGI